MKKYLILLLALVTLLLCFCACEEEKKGRDKDENEDEETTISTETDGSTDVTVGSGEAADSTGTTVGSGDTDSSGEGDKTDSSAPDDGFVKYAYGDMSEFIKLPPFLTQTFDVDADSIKMAIGTYLMQYVSKSSKTICGIGDVVLVSYTGYYIDENGNIVIENGKEKTFDKSDNTSFYIGSNLAIRDFELGIDKMSIGEEKDIYATFPSDYHATDLAGERVLFRVKLKSIYQPPIYNDDFVLTYFQAFRTTEELEAGLMKEYVLSLVYDYITKNAQVIEYPQAEYDMANSQLEDLARDWVENHGMTLDQYIYSTYGMTRGEYIKSNMKTEMIFYSLRNILGKDTYPTEDELFAEKNKLIEEYKNQYMMSNGMKEEEARKAATEFVDALGNDYVYEQVMYEKIDVVISKCVKTNIIESEREYCWETK